MGNPSLNSHKLYDPRSQKENVRSLQGLPKNAGKWKLHLSFSCWPELQAASSGAFGSPLSLKLPSPA